MSVNNLESAINILSRNVGDTVKEIKIGNNVWVGGGVHMDHGITIGDNTVIGAGSVITRDIPANVVAAGAPCRVIREITEADKSDYFNVLETLYDGGK